MSFSEIFISHASADDDFVKELRIKLESHGVSVWVDSRKLRGGSKLTPEIEQAIRQASHVLVVLSPKTVNSPWVRREVNLAELVAKKRKGYRVIPLMLPGIKPTALGSWFDEEPVGIEIQLEPGQLQEKMPDVLAALGERLPDDAEKAAEIEARPVAELLLELYNPELTRQEDGIQRLGAEAQLIYIPTDTKTQREVKSKRFRFVSPVGRIEQDELSWYLEKYYLWPAGLFRERAQRTEAKLPTWGQALYAATLDKHSDKDGPVASWSAARTGAERRFSVRVDAQLLEGASDDEKANALEAASRLFGLPWELLHDGKDYLSGGAHAVRVRRRLPNYENKLPLTAGLPIRILLLSPRPEQEGIGYIDHRASALPLVEAVEALGDLVELSVLTPPTLGALEEALQKARDDKKPFHVLHFDGHGVYDPRHGLGALCFEDPNDSKKLGERRMALVHADKLANVLCDYRIPLVFLEACQTAQSEEDPNASVAARLLQEGVTSVVAMSHSVLVETARRFVTVFYQALAQGQRVGQAMLDGQRELMRNTFRLRIMAAGELHLNDWFVPILYQERHDPQLFDRIPTQTAEKMQAQRRLTLLGELPETPPHTFIGRSRELLTLERLLEHQPYAVIRGQGGAGKTVLAVELARWLVRSRRFERCAFVSLEQYSDARGVLDALGQQLLLDYSVAEYGDDLSKALQPVARELEDSRCLLLLDNLETLLANEAAAPPVLKLAQDLQESDVKTSLLFTTREALPAPFDHRHREITLGALARDDAIELVTHVMSNEGLDLKPDDAGNTPEEITELVDAVSCHARALVLLAQEVSRQGVKATTENLRRIMMELERWHPGKRELSLFASVELSLRRLSAKSRELVKGLAVFLDGADIFVLSQVLRDEDMDATKKLLAELVSVGLAEEKDYSYHRFDPALPIYLGLQLESEKIETYRQRWLEAMSQLLDFLYNQQFKDAQLQAKLTLLDLPNLMAFVRQLARSMEQGQAEAAEVAGKAGRIEQLLADLNRPQALAQVVDIRKRAAKQLGDWSHARFENECLSIERLLEQGALNQALEAAKLLLQRCRQEGEGAYPGADYDLAIANILLGRVLKTGGVAVQALPYLQKAQQGFEKLGEGRAGMASAALKEQGDCLTALGRLDDAATAYEEGIKRVEKLNDTRSIAAVKGELATVRLYQKRYTDALKGHQEALALFSQLDEPRSVATAWHQIGMVHRKAGDFSQAEQAYRRGLSLRVRHKLRSDEAASLGELGNLYDDWNRPEQAVDFYRQAADIHVQLGDLRYEGTDRNNIADTLIKLQRYEEARPELLRAIECDKPFGHAAEPWKTWSILHDLEQASGNTQAAREARRQAIQSYLSYRRDGGENHSGIGRLSLAVWQAMQQGDTTEVEQYIEQALQTWQNKKFLRNLQAILAGERNPALAEGESLHYQEAAELTILLEQLNTQKP